MWSEVDSSMTLHALLGPRDRDNRFLSRFLKKQIIHPALLRGRERCSYPLPKQFPLSLGRPSRGLLLLRLPPVDGGQDGRDRFWRLLRMRCGSGGGCRGRPRRRAGWALQPADGWRQQLPAEAGSVRSPQSAPVAEETSLGYRNLKEPNFVGVPMSTRPSQVALLDHKCGHRTTQRPCHNLRRSWREVRCGTELFQNFRIVTTPMHVPQCF